MTPKTSLQQPVKTHHHETRAIGRKAPAAAAMREPASAVKKPRLAVGVVHLDGDGFDFGALLVPAEDGFADALHSDFRDCAGVL